MGDFDHNDNRKEIFSKAVKAGKRTYFFDVKATKSDDYFLTITESKKRFDQNSDQPFYEKHKIYLYKEDFEKFMEGLNLAVKHIMTNRPDMPVYSPKSERPDQDEKRDHKKFSDLDFDDLGKKED